MPFINDQRTTLNIEQGRRVTDAEPKIALLDPQITPLMAAFGNYGRDFAHKGNNSVEVTGVPLMKRETYNPRFDWWEDAVRDRADAINNVGGYLPGDTALVVDDADVFFAGAEVYVPSTGEIMIVDSVNVGTFTITVRRGIGTVAQALADDDILIVLGSVYPEGTLSRTSKTTLETNQYNYTQIFRTPFSVTRTLDKSKLWTENDYVYEMRKQGIEHLKDIERAFWFGSRSEQVNGVTGTPERTTGGIIGKITTNVESATGTLTEAEWEAFLEEAFQSGSTRKFAFCSPRALSVIAQFGTQKLQVNNPGSKIIYGLSVYEYLSPHGIVHLVRTPLFTEVPSSVVSVIVLDMENVKYRFLSDSDTKLYEDIQENDRDGKKGEYLTECGIQVMLEQTHAILTDVNA
jgi:hypothetical protein